MQPDEAEKLVQHWREEFGKTRVPGFQFNDGDRWIGGLRGRRLHYAWGDIPVVLVKRWTRDSQCSEPAVPAAPQLEAVTHCRHMAASAFANCGHTVTQAQGGNVPAGDMTVHVVGQGARREFTTLSDIPTGRANCFTEPGSGLRADCYLERLA